MDFTYKTYIQLLQALKYQGFSFYTYREYAECRAQSAESRVQRAEREEQRAESREQSAERKALRAESREQKIKQNNDLKNSKESQSILPSKVIILRHDVEQRYNNALRFAEIQHEMGIRGSYYFRLFQVPENEEIIRKIASLGHEIGYHYDDLSFCKGDYEKAIHRFEKNLAYLREIAPVLTLTAEGAPLSKFDNRDLWKKYNYSDYGIIAEPYFDINYDELFYITDTGRRWDGDKYNVRDKPITSGSVRGRSLPLKGKPDGVRRATKENPVTNEEFLKLRFRHTGDIIETVESGCFPERAMLNFHPQRWSDALMPWAKELVWQNVKNQGKRVLLRLRRG